MNQTFHNRSDTDAEVIATLTAISQVSARMAKNLRLIAIHRQSKEGGTTNVKNAVKCSEGSTETTEESSPLSGAASAGWNPPDLNASLGPSMS